ncbi:dihydrofolate reductase family protein [Actinospica durhamensis]|uniref:Dihydrofolate reductase family protein n=1 Tax=Actinospica durhamensis TaxID=1508375 RepID=A0A941IQH7_9ACTN|nr:dihydrofolate reductase family protein [Actinospica durhamensis]MBR7834222.1 dihydrofolate reductase family protein [Actinospica durhamensis]
MSIIVISFVTLDGIASDPDGSAGSAHGGWMFRYGRGPVDGDKFRLGALMTDGALLLGRGTWQAFARLWPAREGAFAERMNAADKLVATRTALDTSAWANSVALEGDLLDRIKQEPRDVVVIGSLSVVRQLAEADLIDEYRLLTFPTVLGAGEPLFPAGVPMAQFDCVDAEPAGELVFTRYRRAAR